MCGIIVARFPETRLDPEIVMGCLPIKLEVDNALSWLGRMICSWGNIYCNIIVCGRRVGRMLLNPSVVIARYGVFLGGSSVMTGF